MDMKPQITTNRLELSQWQKQDLEPFAKLNSDPKVMQFFPSTLNREQSDQLVDKIKAHFDKYGYGLWSTSLKETGEFIGFIGLLQVGFEAHFTPAIEIGWRLDHKFWGKGYATEGASVVIDYAFNTLKISEIVSFTSQLNLPSIRLMKRLGMTHDNKDDFDHPRLDSTHRLCRHCLFRKRSY
ncbi:MAG: GNAT family N-acetyltransferase [Rhabdochlamydiaceae bacterium]|nr:GNAT family N-acetyltransferase [Candidatus Amphrikana amoebophyrae]